MPRECSSAKGNPPRRQLHRRLEKSNARRLPMSSVRSCNSARALRLTRRSERLARSIRAGPLPAPAASGKRGRAAASAACATSGMIVVARRGVCCRPRCMPTAKSIELCEFCEHRSPPLPPSRRSVSAWARDPLQIAYPRAAAGAAIDLDVLRCRRSAKHASSVTKGRTAHWLSVLAFCSRS